MQKLLFSAVFFFAFLAQPAPNLSGTWQFDPTASTGQPAAKGASFLVVSQSGDELTFDYYGVSAGKRGKLVESAHLSADGRRHAGNKIRTYTSYVTAYWNRNKLVVQSKAVLDPDGYQTFSTEDRWSLSNDGNTLTDSSSDGTQTIYRRQPNAEP